MSGIMAQDVEPERYAELTKLIERELVKIGPHTKAGYENAAIIIAGKIIEADIMAAILRFYEYRRDPRPEGE